MSYQTRHYVPFFIAKEVCDMSNRAKPQAKTTQIVKAEESVKVVPRKTLTKTPKVIATQKVTPIIPSAVSVKEEKPKKTKIVRDSFTMPKDEYEHISTIKARCLKAGVGVKKSEVLRAALSCLAALSDAALVDAIGKLKPLKTGRPAKE